MNVLLTRKFQKQVNDCDNQRIKNKVGKIITDVIRIKYPGEIKNIKKITGAENCYRIRIGDTG